MWFFFGFVGLVMLFEWVMREIFMLLYIVGLIVDMEMLGK